MFIQCFFGWTKANISVFSKKSRMENINVNLHSQNHIRSNKYDNTNTAKNKQLGGRLNPNRKLIDVF
jgi:hypothetical protein